MSVPCDSAFLSREVHCAKSSSPGWPAPPEIKTARRAGHASARGAAASAAPEPRCTGSLRGCWNGYGGESDAACCARTRERFSLQRTLTPSRHTLADHDVGGC
eukprot:359953-Chlamydomonas_euryale.AAC.4